MASRRKVKIKDALKQSHIEAIGRVAATWSRLEISVVAAISHVSRISLEKTILFCAPISFFNWMEILTTLIKGSQAHRWEADSFGTLRGQIEKLYSERNSVVHAFWLEPQAPSGTGLLSSKIFVNLPPGETARGFSLPKRGQIKSVEKTASDIREIAKKIQDAEKSLAALIYRPRSRPTPQQIAQALLTDCSSHQKTKRGRSLAAPPPP